MDDRKTTLLLASARIAALAAPAAPARAQDATDTQVITHAPEYTAGLEYRFF